MILDKLLIIIPLTLLHPNREKYSLQMALLDLKAGIQSLKRWCLAQITANNIILLALTIVFPSIAMWLAPIIIVRRIANMIDNYASSDIQIRTDEANLPPNTPPSSNRTDPLRYSDDSPLPNTQETGDHNDDGSMPWPYGWLNFTQNPFIQAGNQARLREAEANCQRLMPARNPRYALMTETQKDDLIEYLKEQYLFCTISRDIPEIPMTLGDNIAHENPHGSAYDFKYLLESLKANARSPMTRAAVTLDTFIARAESSVAQTQNRINEQIDLFLDQPPTNQPR